MRRNSLLYGAKFFGGLGVAISSPPYLGFGPAVTPGLVDLLRVRVDTHDAIVRVGRESGLFAGQGTGNEILALVIVASLSVDLDVEAGDNPGIAQLGNDVFQLAAERRPTTHELAALWIDHNALFIVLVFALLIVDSEDQVLFIRDHDRTLLRRIVKGDRVPQILAHDALVGVKFAIRFKDLAKVIVIRHIVFLSASLMR